MSLSNNAENLLCNLIFRNSGIPNVGNAGGLLPSSADGSLHTSLHTADPGETGSQSTNEISYTGYLRPAATRGSGWTVTSSGVFNAGQIDFPICVGGSGSASFFGLGTVASGAGTLLFSSSFNSPLTIVSGITSFIPVSGMNIIGD